jgi:hypothetical protein
MLLLPFNNSLVASSIFIIEGNRIFFLVPRLCLGMPDSEALPRRNREAEPPDLPPLTEPRNEGIGGSASRE